MQAVLSMMSGCRNQGPSATGSHGTCLAGCGLRWATLPLSCATAHCAAAHHTANAFLAMLTPARLCASVCLHAHLSRPSFSPAKTNSYKKLAQDVKPGSSILCADGSIVLEVISTDPAAGTVRARCKNTAMLG